MHDCAAERVVTEIRLYQCSAYVETRTLFDFDTERHCWRTDGESRRVEISDLKEASRIALAMAAQLDALPHRNAMGAVEMYH